MRVLSRSLLAAALLAGAAMPAFAQMESREAIALQNQVLQLQQQIQYLAARMQQGGGGGYYQGAPAPGPQNGDLTAQLLDRVSRLEDQVRDLRGRMDELQNTVQQQGADLNKQIGDLKFAMQQGGGGGGAPSSAPAVAPPGGSLGTAPQQSGQAAPTNARRPPELAMQEGNAALARRDYPAAEAAAREVLQNSGRSPRAYDAQFLLAQSLLGQHNYQAAAVAFDDTYNRAHGGNRAQDSLLGLANSLMGLGDKQASCGALDKLRMEFPNMRADVKTASAGARQRAGCR
jgi:TolA-binding protein